jgi:hypothetical protein
MNISFLPSLCVNFDRYFTIQLGVFGTVHLAHPTLADGRENLIRTGFVPVESGI